MKVTKRAFLSSAIALAIISLAFPIPSSAKSIHEPQKTEMISLSNGCYVEITTTENIIIYGMSRYDSIGKTGEKTYCFKNAKGQAQWSATLSASFNKIGHIYTCSSVSMRTSMLSSNWKVDNNSTSRAGNSAFGNITCSNYMHGRAIQTLQQTITLSCDSSGNLY